MPQVSIPTQWRIFYSVPWTMARHVSHPGLNNVIDQWSNPGSSIVHVLMLSLLFAIQIKLLTFRIGC